MILLKGMATQLMKTFLLLQLQPNLPGYPNFWILKFCFLLSCTNRGMKWRRTFVCHHRNEWVIVHSLSKACFTGPIAVWAWARCHQWMPHQPPWQWRASSAGMVSSECKHNPLPELRHIKLCIFVMLCSTTTLQYSLNSLVVTLWLIYYIIY